MLLATPAIASMEPMGSAGRPAASAYIDDPLLVEALGLIEAEMLAEAEGMLTATAESPGRPGQFHYVKARLLSAQGRPVEALESLRLSFIYAGDVRLKELVLLERAEGHLSLKFSQEAQADFLIFLRMFPGSALMGRARLGLAESLMAQGRYSGAERNFREAGRGPEAVFGRARALHMLKRYHYANRIYRSGIAGHGGYLSGSPGDRYYFGENLRHLGRLEEAREQLSKVEVGEYKDLARIGLGRIAFAGGDIKEAVVHFKEALNSASREARIGARLGLADAYLGLGDTGEAEAVLLEVRRDYPYGRGYDDAMLKLARLYSERGQYGMAVRLLKELVFRRSPRKEALDEFEAILLEVKEKDREQFLALWKAVGPWMFDRSRQHSLISVMETLKEEGEPYLEITEWLSRYGSNDLKKLSFSELSRFYVRKGSISTARKFLSRLQEMRGVDDEVNRIEAAISFIGRDFQAAADRIMKIKEPVREDLSLLADTLLHISNVKAALGYLEGAFKNMDPGAEIYASVADAFYELGQKKKALKYYDLALARDAGHQWAAYRAGSLSGGKRARLLFGMLRGGGTPISRSAEAGLREMDMKQKLREVF